jgi:hypothetical protein
LPTAQSWQAAVKSAPWLFTNFFPAEHAEQKVAPVLPWYSPVAQLVQPFAFPIELEYFPFSQEVHELAASAE